MGFVVFYVVWYVGLSCTALGNLCPLGLPSSLPSVPQLSPYLGQDLLGQGQGPVVGSITLVILSHSMVYQAQCVGLCPVQSPACEDELLRQGHAQAAGQPLSPSCQCGEVRAVSRVERARSGQAHPGNGQD